MKARIYRSSKREFDCRLESGKIVKATALGNLLKKDAIVVGDWVELERPKNINEYQIHSVESRKNEIFRMLIRENKKKVSASNVDYLVILLSVSRPRFKRGIIDRFLVRACQWGVEPIVIFNKMDQYDPSECDIYFEEERLRGQNVTCFEISAKFYDDYSHCHLKNGLPELKEKLLGKTSIFVGQSGVGKSKTISCLAGDKIELRTSEVGKAGKGSHTTTWSEMIDCHGFYLIDSPGIRSFSLEDINPDDLIQYFPDLAEISLSCQFNDCTHRENARKCAFYENDWSEKDRSIILSRLESYLRIREEVSGTPEWQKRP